MWSEGEGKAVPRVLARSIHFLLDEENAEMKLADKGAIPLARPNTNRPKNFLGLRPGQRARGGQGEGILMDLLFLNKTRQELESEGRQGDDEGDKRASGQKIMGVLRPAVKNRGVIESKRRPHQYTVEIPPHGNQLRAVTLELRPLHKTSNMDIYVLRESAAASEAGPTAFDWRGIGDTDLVIKPTDPKLLPGRYKVAIFSDLAPAAYTIRFSTQRFRDETAVRNGKIAGSLLNSALRQRLALSELNRRNAKNTDRPLSAPLLRGAAEGGGDAVIGERDLEVLKEVLEDEKPLMELTTAGGKMQPFSMRSRTISVNDFSFNPEQIRNNLSTLIDSISQPRSVKAREVLATLDAESLALRLTNAILEDKINPPSLKVLAPPRRGKSRNTTPHGQPPGRSQTAFPHKSMVQPTWQLRAERAGLTGDPPVNKKLAMLKNLGGLPKTRIAIFEPDLVSYTIWRCTLDEMGAVWAAEEIDETRELTGAEKNLLCRLTDLQTCDVCTLRGQPPGFYSFRFNLAQGVLVLSVFSEEDRAVWMHAGQLLSAPPELAISTRKPFATLFTNADNVLQSSKAHHSPDHANHASTSTPASENEKPSSSEAARRPASAMASTSAPAAARSSKSRRPRPSSGLAAAPSHVPEASPSSSEPEKPAQRPRPLSALQATRPSSALPATRSSSALPAARPTSALPAARPSSALARVPSSTAAPAAKLPPTRARPASAMAAASSQAMPFSAAAASRQVRRPASAMASSQAAALSGGIVL